ncbi:MAG: ABC transporter permease [Bacteroidaceae bacterium]|nr:ABC transporter permease [Bacteroidaceae bacterium]
MTRPKFPILHVWMDELSELVKDEGILIFVILLPLAYPLLYAMIYNTETQRELPMCVVDESMSQRSREFVRRVDATQEVRIAAHATDMSQAQELMRRRDVSAILRIPAEFDSDIWNGRQTVVGLYSDLTSMLYYKVAYLGVINVAQETNRNIKVRERMTPASTAREDDVARWPIRFEEVKLYNPQGGFAAFLIPPVLMLILQQALCLGVGMSMGRARERFRGLVIPPTRHYKNTLAIVLGKGLVHFLIFMLMALYMSVCVTRWFSLPQLAHFATLVGFFVPYLLACTYMAIFWSSFIYRREDCILLFVFMSIPLLFLSGVSWPGASIPPLWKAVGAAFPSTWGANAYVRISGMGATLGDVHSELLALWVLAGVYFLLSCLTYMHEIRKSVGRSVLS